MNIMEMSQTNIFITYILFSYIIYVVNGQFIKKPNSAKANEDAIRPAIEQQFPELKRDCIEEAVRLCAYDISEDAVSICSKLYYETRGWSCDLSDSPTTTNNPEAKTKLDITRISEAGPQLKIERKSDSDDYDC